MKNDLGDRMKQYEAVNDIKLTRRLPMVIRLDGKAFHSWTKRTGCVRPFDYTLIEMMAGLTKYLCEEIGGTVLGYCQSDEISLLVRDDQKIDSQPWFDKRLQKITSLSSSLATYWFNANNAFSRKLPAFFDARAFILPENEIRNYFIWRQEDATTNSLSMLAQSLYHHNELQRKKWAELQDLCWAKGYNWNALPTSAKRGTCVYKRDVNITHSGTTITRRKFIIDSEIPVFTSAEADLWWSQFLS